MVILPKLYDANGSTSKKWFVYYSVRNPKTDKMERFRIFSGLGKESTKVERYATAENLIAGYTEKLRAGWTPFDSRQSGVIYEDELEFEVVAQIYRKKRADNTTFHYYASTYISKVKNKLEPESLRNYKSVMRVFLTWTKKEGITENDISFYTQPIVAKFFQFLIDELERSKRTVKRYRNVLNGVFELAREEKKIMVNPLYDLPGTARVNDHTPRPIKEEDVKVFFREIKKDSQLYLAALIQMYCFIRPGNEMRNLKISDIDWARRTIRVDRGFSKVHKERKVTIPEFLADMMRNEFQLHHCKQDYFIFSSDGKPGPIRLGKNTLRKKFNKVRERLGMPDSYKFYSWKHTGGILAADLNVPLHEIQAQMGHSNIATTIEYLKNHGAYRNPNFSKMENRF